MTLPSQRSSFASWCVWLVLAAALPACGDDGSDTSEGGGDSITDGVGSTLDANHRYPNYLAERVRAEARWAGYGVIDEGISGNRILNDVAGPSALSRFGRDVIGQSGASHVIPAKPRMALLGACRLAPHVTPG
jgi:hypothetical protein